MNVLNADGTSDGGGWYEAGSKNTNFNHVETGKTRCESLEVGHDLD